LTLNALNAADPLLDVPLVVGVTSHRNLAPSEIEPIRLRIREFFARLRQEFPELPLVVMSALAEGGDQLVAEEALAIGARLIAPLPLSPETYAEDFIDAPSRAKFSELCALAEVLQMPVLPGSTKGDIAVHGQARDRQYAQAGVFIASHSHIMLAVWDGRESDLLGGTAQVIRYALEGVMPGWIERRQDAHVELDRIDESIVYHIACSRTAENDTLLAPVSPLVPMQTRWISQKQVWTADAGMPREFHRLFARMQEFDLDQHRYADEILAAASGSEIASADSTQHDDLDRLFNAADSLALHFQKRVLWAMRSNHVLAVLTGIALVVYSDLPGNLPYQFYGIYLFVILFGIGALLAWLARRRDWHRKYVDYRALAEGLRVQWWWRRAGIAAGSSSAFAHESFMQEQDIELGWIRNVMRVASMDRIENAAVSESALAQVISEWIGEPGQGGQLDYYRRKGAQRSKTYRTTRSLGGACFVAGISVAVLLVLFQSSLGSDNTTLLVALMGVLAILAAALESYTYRNGDKELINRYRYMFGIFTSARSKLDAASDAEHRGEILRALGEAALAEHSEWVRMHRERPLENARF
jgi:hypothetical protein